MPVSAGLGLMEDGNESSAGAQGECDRGAEHCHISISLGHCCPSAALASLGWPYLGTAQNWGGCQPCHPLPAVPEDSPKPPALPSNAFLTETRGHGLGPPEGSRVASEKGLLYAKVCQKTLGAGYTRATGKASG